MLWLATGQKEPGRFFALSLHLVTGCSRVLPPRLIHGGCGIDQGANTLRERKTASIGFTWGVSRGNHCLFMFFQFHDHDPIYSEF